MCINLLMAAAMAVNVSCEKPVDRGAWFREARFGMFIHWGIYSIPGKGEWTYANDKYAPGEYEAYAKEFNPVNYRPREWAKLAKAAGMKYAVLTSRHHDGFCMFDSHFTDYKITNTPYGKDAVREFLDAFRAEGLKVGLYHSLPDWTHPGYADTESPECISGGKKEPHVPTPEQYNAFTNLVFNHINQLTTEYGKLDLLFLDYTSRTKADLDYFGRDRILEMIYRNQPHILVNDRLSYFKDNCRDFDYYTPEICVPNQPQQVKGREVMWETCATMNNNWGYCRADENWKSPEAVVAGLIGCVSKNGNLLLNVGPTELGEIPEGSQKILRALADWNRANGESVTGCGASSYTPPHGCVYTQKGNALYCHFLQSPLGDTILPQLKDKIVKATLLRTGKELEQVNHWGFELLKSDEQRLRTREIIPGDVVRLDLVPAVDGSKPALKILMIGNSFSTQMTKAMPPIAQNLGLGLDICSMFIGGCSLERHWKNICAPTSMPYSVSRRTTMEHKGYPVRKGNIPETLASEKWDIVTIQQCSHMSWQPDSYHPWGDDLVKYIREHAPQAKIVVQETWSYTPWDKRLAGWKIDQNEMYEKLHVAYADFAKAYGFDIIPTGTAVQLVRKELPVKYTENSLGGDVVGSAKFVEKDGKWVPKGDVFHMGADGNYLQALVWTAKLFDVDVTKCTYAPANMSAERATFLRRIAMKAVKP